MAGTSVDHCGVAAYAMGLLGPTGMSAFEQHVAGCQRCADELEELVAVAVLLAEVRPAPPAARPTMAARPLRASRRGATVANRRPPDPPGPGDRRRVAHRLRRWRIRTGLAAVLAVSAFIIGLVGGARLADRTAPPSVLPPIRELYVATDPHTGVSARVGVVGTGWGSEIDLRVTGVSGPDRCELVGVGRDGTEQVALTWGVSADSGAASSLEARGGLAAGRAELDHFEVRGADGRVLVRVPVAG